jgi:hypothetical protein
MLSYIVPLIGLAYMLYYALIGSKNVNTDIVVTDEEEVAPQAVAVEK